MIRRPKEKPKGKTKARSAGRSPAAANASQTLRAAKPAQPAKPVKAAGAPKAAKTTKIAKAAKTAVVRKAAAPAAPAPLLHEVLRGGQGWSRRLARGQILRITDLTGRATVAALFYNAHDPGERYNMADTLKAQYTAFLTAGRVLYSDMGRVLVSIVDDSCGWHDTISGCENAAASDATFGVGGYQELRNDFHRNTRDNFIVELSKAGLGRRDIVANVSFFAKVSADDAGRIDWVAGNSVAGAYVELRAEMDTLVVLSNTPHPMDPSPIYEPPPIELTIRTATARELPGPDDRCRLSRPENGRGFALTEAYVAEIGAAR